MIIHVVRKGETLNRIANQYGTQDQLIAAANELPDPNQLLVGQSLVIPIAAIHHTVRGGETLWGIAQKYGIQFNALLQANPHVSSHPTSLSVGTIIVIPPRTHVVRAGETLWQIAQNYQINIQELIQANHIQNLNQIVPGMVLIIPFPKPVIDVNAYTINTGETAAQELREVAKYLTFIAPFVYSVKEDGTLSSLQDEAVIQVANENQIVPMMCITNFSSTETGTALAHHILSNQQLQNTLLDHIVQVMREKGYKGLNVDFENVQQSDREAYNQFLQGAVNRLHPLGFFVSTAVAPKTSSEQKGLLYEAHDYEAQGRIVDFVILMTYEWGYRFGPPQAISPINQMKKVIDYAVTVIPRNKIFMGFQLYARDWLLPHVEGQEAETFDMQEALRRALKYKVAIQYDTVAQSPYFRYTDEQGKKHEVWYEDARSAQAKFDLVKQYHLQGISYWVLGYPFPQNWLLLSDNFTIQKR
ncbi:LysM peptidoglycan-binding domain-containing protein [Lederbergia galactosidilytica]|uniref:Spore gernimation protein n=1 Tax=Lederbergia galactosidilytica TaxID=217031 RepID=A0A178A249_9BACI|nr:LysM peptidoglycan-binding domain-containing protein [Lederbergia galactosidilytica]MBP1913827.1 spore germination protein [Lederbergia galactosidilytica]OAK73879.1 spore gernimation protein [Lederbergia galactosidilytica]